MVTLVTFLTFSDFWLTFNQEKLTWWDFIQKNVHLYDENNAVELLKVMHFNKACYNKMHCFLKGKKCCIGSNLRQ